MDVESAGAAVSEDLGNDDESNTPALFVTSMPRDLWANPSLGALAALIDEAHDEEKHGDEQARAREKAEAVATSGDESDSKHSTLPQPREAAENTKSRVLSSSSEGGSITSTVAGKIHRDDVQRKRSERRASPYGDSASARRGSKLDKDDGLAKKRPTPGEAQVLMSLWSL